MSDPMGFRPNNVAEVTGVRGELQERGGWKFLRVDGVGEYVEPFPGEIGNWVRMDGSARRLGRYHGTNQHGYGVFMPSLYTDDSPILGLDGEPLLTYRFVDHRPIYISHSQMGMVGPPCDDVAEDAIRRIYGEEGL
ncbi:MAG: hypothetical protein ABH864_04270 [archaeon]